jgi:hypothetical protein
MKHIFSYLFTLFCIFGHGQNSCSVCPAGSSVQLTSPHPATASHQWTCTNGFTSNLQNPTFSPSATTVCTLTATNASGCISTTTTTVNVCNCNNNPCLNMSFNESTNCLNFQNVGTITSPVTSDVREYLREFSSTWTTVPVSNQLCGCDIRAKINVTPTCSFNTTTGRFALGYNATICAGTTINNWNWIPNIGSTISGVTSSTSDWISLTPAELNSSGNGGVLTIRNRVSTSPLTFAFAKIRFVYSGSGTTCASITSTVLEEGTYYYDFQARRTVNFSDGCPAVICSTAISLPVGNICQVDGYLSSVNFSPTDCASPSSGLAMTVFNMTAPVTYQWRRNGVNIPNNPSTFTWGHCLTGQPFGEYCCIATDANGCQASGCVIYQGTCNANVSVSLSGTTLTATPSGCTGTASYQWQRWNGSSWVNVGTGSTYNTTGISGDYKVILSCTGPPACSSQAVYTYSNPCNINLSISATTTTLTASITGCGGTSIVYTWQRWNGSSWVQVATTTTTTTTNSYTPTQSGLYRINTLCNSCSGTAQISFTMPNLCAGFSVFISGATTLCNNTGYTFTRNITGGTAPFSTTWRINGVIVGTGVSYTYTPTSTGSANMTVSITDANSCTVQDQRTLNIINCCSMSTAISPSSTTLCSNTSQTFTRSITGGTAPFSTTWNYSLNGGSSVFMGTGASVAQTFTTSGTYVITATTTDNTGCVSVAQSTVTVNNCTTCNCSANMIASAGCQLIVSTTGADCSGYSYQLQYSATGTGWSIVQSGSLSGFTYTPTQNGFYRLVGVKPGCSIIEITIQITCVVASCSNPPSVNLTSTSSTQCGLGAITIPGTQGGSSTLVSHVSTTGGTGSISISNASSTNWSFTYTPTSYGTHVITFTTNNPLGSPCAPATTQYTLTTLNNPTPSITSSGAAMCVGDTRTLTATPAGGAWSASGAGGTVSGNTLTATNAGTVSVNYLLNQNGCTGSATQTITVSGQPTTPVVSTNCAGGAGNAVLTVTSPVGAGLEYRLNSGAWQSTTTFSNVTNGSYTISVRNASGCVNQTTVNVNCGCASPPSVVYSTPSQTVCLPNSATITGTFTNATQVTFSHNGTGSLNTNVATSSPFSIIYTPGLFDNNVIITATTNNPLGAPCSPSTSAQTIIVYPLVTVPIAGDADICLGQSTSVTASGGTTYNWCCGLGTGATKTLSPASTTTYTVTATSSTGCTGVGSITVIVTPNPTPSITSSGAAMCVGDTRVLTGTPAGGAWSASGAGAINAGSIVATNPGTIAITYTVTSGECTGTATQNITVNANPPNSVTHTTTCNNGVGTAVITSPVGAYEYSIFNGSWSAYQTSTTFTGLAPGLYNLRIKNIGNLCEITVVGAININCVACTCPTPTINQNDCVFTLSNTCVGYTHTWQVSLNGTSGWTNLVSGVNTINGDHQKYYRVYFTKPNCIDVVTNVLQGSCNCKGMTMAIYNDNTTKPNIGFSDLLYNGSPMTNYRLQWKRITPAPTTTVFYSGKGTGLTTGTYAHPPNFPIPTRQGNYNVDIISSDFGTHTNCFFTSVTDKDCTVEEGYIKHVGIAGADAAVQTWSYQIPASTIAIGISKVDFGNPTETMEVIYNGVVIHTRTTNGLSIYIPITYVSGQNRVIFRFTNNNTAIAAGYTVGGTDAFENGISCCSYLNCDVFTGISFYVSPSQILCYPNEAGTGHQFIFKGTNGTCTPCYVDDQYVNVPSGVTQYDFTITSTCNTPCTPGTTGSESYRLNFRNNSCKCQSWQLWKYNDNTSAYDILATQASGWTGTCL